MSRQNETDKKRRHRDLRLSCDTQATSLSMTNPVRLNIINLLVQLDPLPAHITEHFVRQDLAGTWVAQKSLFPFLGSASLLSLQTRGRYASFDLESRRRIE